MALKQADYKTRSRLLEFAESKPDTPEYYRWLRSLRVSDRVKLNGLYSSRELTVDQIQKGLIICNADVKFNQATGYEANRAASASKTWSSWVGKP